MKKKYLSKDDFLIRYAKLSQPLYKANLSLMKELLANPEISKIIKTARKELKNNKARKQEVLQSYLDKIITTFNIYRHFKPHIERFITHKEITAPMNNVIRVGIRQASNDRKPFLTIEFGRMPYTQDWAIAKLLLKNPFTRFASDRIPDKYRISYRQKRKLGEHLRIVREASKRIRTSTFETIKIENSDIADLVYENSNKASNVSKVLYRQKLKEKALASLSK